MNCYPATCPDLSDRLLAAVAARADRWCTPAELYRMFPDYSEARTRNALHNLRDLGYLQHDRRGYRLRITQAAAAQLFAWKDTPTQRNILEGICRNGFMYARQFKQDCGGGTSQFLRAVRRLEAAGVVQSKTEPVPGAPHVLRRIYFLSDKAQKHESAN